MVCFLLSGVLPSLTGVLRIRWCAEKIRCRDQTLQPTLFLRQLVVTLFCDTVFVFLVYLRIQFRKATDTINFHCSCFLLFCFISKLTRSLHCNVSNAPPCVLPRHNIASGAADRVVAGGNQKHLFSIFLLREQKTCSRRCCPRWEPKTPFTIFLLWEPKTPFQVPEAPPATRNTIPAAENT